MDSRTLTTVVLDLGSVIDQLDSLRRFLLVQQHGEASMAIDAALVAVQRARQVVQEEIEVRAGRRRRRTVNTLTPLVVSDPDASQR